MAVIMPNVIDYNVLIATQAIKTEVLADITYEIGELEFDFQVKKRAYERIGERRAKAVSDLSVAVPRIADLNAAIALLPNGPIILNKNWYWILEYENSKK